MIFSTASMTELVSFRTEPWEIICCSEWLCKLLECIILYYSNMEPLCMASLLSYRKNCFGRFQTYFKWLYNLLCFTTVFSKKIRFWKAVALLLVKYQCKVIIDFFSAVSMVFDIVLRLTQSLSGVARCIYYTEWGCTKRGAGGAYYKS